MSAPTPEPIVLVHPSGIHPVPAYLSPASIANGVLFIGGQVALEASGTVVGIDDVRRQTEQVLSNLHAVLTECGSTFRHLASLTIYLRSMDDFEGFNEVYARVLDGWNPPRTTVESRLVHPDFLIEIQAFAVVADGRLTPPLKTNGA